MVQIRTVTSYGPGAGSARVRVFDWLDHLAIEADSFTYLGRSTNSLGSLAKEPFRIPGVEAELRRLVRTAEGTTVLLSRQASPFSNGLVERDLLARSSHGVYDFDDALMHTPVSRRESVWSKRRVWRKSVEGANTVIAGNDFLASEASRHHRNVVVIPSCVAPESYLVKAQYGIHEVPRAVWLGSPSTELYLKGIAGPLLAVHETRGLRLSVVSAGNASLGALDKMVDRVEWARSTFQQELVKADFGIMPLVDSLWSRGKCAYKLLQYGAAGLPMLGSAVGANDSVLKDADGMAVSSDSEWRDALESLVDEPENRRSSRGQNGRLAIQAKYSYTAWADSWQSAMGLA
ncbi:glycosyltransferase [Cryobacterium sp. TMT1-19]|nr:glycosyltransferase [Cryobacterium sp. TMT1-19]